MHKNFHSFPDKKRKIHNWYMTDWTSLWLTRHLKKKIKARHLSTSSNINCRRDTYPSPTLYSALEKRKRDRKRELASGAHWKKRERERRRETLARTSRLSTYESIAYPGRVASVATCRVDWLPPPPAAPPPPLRLVSRGASSTPPPVIR